MSVRSQTGIQPETSKRPNDSVTSPTSPTFVRERPSLFRKYFFKMPTYLYWGPSASLLKSRSVMMLTTTGRSTGLPRKTGVSFMELNGRYIIFTGWGVTSDWYKNLLMNPEATIQVGRETIEVVAHPVEDPERRKALMVQMKSRSDECGPPPLIRPLFKATHIFDYDHELQIALDRGGNLAVIELVPPE